LCIRVSSGDHSKLFTDKPTGHFCTSLFKVTELLISTPFLTLKGFLLELAGHQEGVGAVLEEGARMLSEGGLSRDEEDEVRVQMRLLNSRWEDLRIKAMERQFRYFQI
jgi:hypothetical protein